MTLYRWGFEGQSNGTTPTTANSDDFGDPICSVTAPTGAATCTYSTAHPIYGTVGIVLTAAAGETVTLRTPTFTATASLAFQAFLYLTAYPTVSLALAQWRTSGGNQFAVNMDTSGRIYLVDNSGSSPVTLLRSAAVPLTTAYQYDAVATIGSANNNSAFKHRLIRVSDAVQLDEQTSTTANLNNAAAAAAMLVTGQHGKPNSAGAIAAMYMDSVAWENGQTGYITAPSTAYPLVPAGTAASTGTVSALGLSAPLVPAGTAASTGAVSAMHLTAPLTVTGSAASTGAVTFALVAPLTVTGTAVSTGSIASLSTAIPLVVTGSAAATASVEVAQSYALTIAATASSLGHLDPLLGEVRDITVTAVTEPSRYTAVTATTRYAATVEE